MTRHNKLIGVSAVVAAGLLAVSACGKDDKKSDDPAPESKATTGTDNGPDDKAPDDNAPDKTTETKPAGLEAVTLSKPATADETTAAAELAKKLLDPASQSEAASDKANARLLVILAATHADPKVIGAALGGMHSVFEWEAAKGDADFTAVVAGRLAATDNTVLAPALRAADYVIRGDDIDEHVAAALIALISNSANPPGQYEGISLLNGWRNSNKDAKLVAALIAAMDSDAAYVASDAIGAMSSNMPDPVPDASALQTKVHGLMKHSNPGVRGQACELLAKFVPWGDDAKAEEIGKLFIPLLQDENPYVRSEAASGLASVKYKAGIHAIMPLLDDPTNNTFDIKDWQTPWGQTGWNHHDGSAWSRVDDAALRAISSMTFFDDDKDKFTYDVNVDSVEADLAKAVSAAKKWYEAHKTKLPPAP